MEIRVFDSEQRVGEAAAARFIEQLRNKPDSVLGMATGSSPLIMYGLLIDACRAGTISFADAVTFNLDEYCGLDAADPHSYHSYMRKNLFDRIDIDPANTHIPNGNAADITAECAAYDAAIESAGGIDLQVLGIGGNGHIGFNEPSDAFSYGTFVVDLAESTIEANKRFFTRAEDVPRRAVTMGVGSIMNARSIVLIATGAKKAQAVRDMIRGGVTPACPASILQNHPDALILLDGPAASLL